jgi:hypothetical protein
LESANKGAKFMLQRDSQHSEQCWFLAIPKSFAPTPPKFPLGLFVRLSGRYQNRPDMTFYGQVMGIEWDERFGFWVYAVEPPAFHVFAEDTEMLRESALEQRLIEDGCPIEQVSG